MPVHSDEYNKVCVITVEGELSVENAAALRTLAEERVNSQNIVDFVVDMEKTSFVDSEGLETLLWLKRRCDDLFGQMKLAALDEDCRKIMEITRLEQRFDCQPDVPAALKMMG